MNIIVDGADPKEKLDYTQKVFELIKKRNVRAGNAVARRQALGEAMSKNEELAGPLKIRFDWIRETACKVVRLLGESGMCFNTMYGDDLVIANDLTDVLATASEMIKAK